MKAIVTSLGMIVFVAAVVVGGTGAFFTDTETSTANVFTAGAIDLKVDSEQHYNGKICIFDEEEDGWVWGPGEADYPVTGTPCDGSWTLTDLGPSNKFFNFGDVKPGDEGENTISLHIDNNPAWACLNIKTTENNENTNIEPEQAAGDVSSPAGELAQNIKFQAWLDQGPNAGFGNDTKQAGEGDNIWQQGEPALSNGTLSSIQGSGVTLALADSVTGSAIAPSVTNYVGLYWCAGTITGGAGNLGCDGSTMGNESQTDSVKADVTFNVVQERHNEDFRCVPLVSQEA